MRGAEQPMIGMVVALALVAGGCGSASSSTTATSRSKTAGSAGSATSGRTGSASKTQPGGLDIPAGSVAVVAGTPITRASFMHWMYVAAKSQGSQSPGQPVIVPDPPAYKHCIAQVHQASRLKTKAVKTLRAVCAQLYQTLSSQAMGFLIEADWLQADAARHGIVPTDAQVEHALNTAKRAQFPGESQFHVFLAKTGESLSDLRFRFRINLIATRLAAREKGSTNVRESAVAVRDKKLFRPQTRCAPSVLMADCGNYRAG